MSAPSQAGVKRVVLGPAGNVLTLAALPVRDTTRWVVRRKAEVVAAVEGGLLSVDEACARYGLTLDEFLSWQQAVARHGLGGLKVRRLQVYRAAEQARAPSVDAPLSTRPRPAP